MGRWLKTMVLISALLAWAPSSEGASHDRSPRTTSADRPTRRPANAGAPRRPKPPKPLLRSESTASVSLETRAFDNDGQPESVDRNVAVSGTFDLKLKRRKLEGRAWNMGRFGLTEPSQRRVFAYEDWLGYNGSFLRLRGGWQIENWAVQEFFRPSDVFNSRNLDSDIQDPEKLGELAASARLPLFNGYMTLFYMPMFMSPVFPAASSRLSALPPGTKLGSQAYVGADATIKAPTDLATQYAIRISQKIGPADFGLHFIDHIDRTQPVIVADRLTGAPRPVFLPVRQAGLNGVIVPGDVILKFDFAHRDFAPGIDTAELGAVERRDHSLGSLGIEYTYAHDSGLESTFFLEWQKIIGVDSDEAATLDLFQNDLATGYRFSLNDMDSKELRAFVIWDLDRSGEAMWSVNYQQRIGSRFKPSFGYRGVAVAGGKTALTPYYQSDHVYVNLTCFF